jgi:hypothetical protein
MPQFIIPLIGLAVAGTSTGLSLADVGTGSPQKAADQQLLQQQQQQAAADQLQKQKAIQATLANSQEQSGGFLQTPQLVNLASVIAGLPGEATQPNTGGKAAATYFGTPSDTNLVSSTYGLSGGQG